MELTPRYGEEPVIRVDGLVADPATPLLRQRSRLAELLAGLSDDAEDIPYPFLHGPMFEAWKATAGLRPDETPPLASGRLDQVAARVTAG